MVEIPGFPEYIRVIPPSPNSGDDPDRVVKKQVWMDWRIEAIRYRLRRAAEVDGDVGEISRELALCAKSFPYWLSMYCYIYDPRDADGQSEFTPDGVMIWIPFDRQIELFQAIHDCMAARGAEANLAVSKSREVGASWIICAYNLWKWLFAPTWSAVLLSRKEDLVESGDPQSLFWKVMFILERLPDWMLPRGYSRRLHKTDMLLKHPDGLKFITGESTNENAGRGNRASIAFLDEAAFMRNLEEVYTGLINSTRHIVMVSSESIDTNRHFHEITSGRVQPSPTVFEFNWWECPWHDDAWLCEQKAKFALNMNKFYREVLRNPLQGSTTTIYSVPERSKPSADYFYIRNAGPLVVQMDPGIRDDFAMVFAQDNMLTGDYVILDAYQNTGMDAKFYVSLIQGIQISRDDFHYGADEQRIMQAFRAWNDPSVIFYGDVYGNNRMGAKAQSVYDVFRDAGYYVNIDRTPEGKLTANQTTARSIQGRRGYLRDLMPRIKFADTPGAILVHQALQYHKLKEMPEGSIYATDESEKDWTSHIVAALEYGAVHRSRSMAFDLAAGLRSGDRAGSLESGITYLG